jgi:hypothetical protein
VQEHIDERGILVVVRDIGDGEEGLAGSSWGDRSKRCRVWFAVRWAKRTLCAAESEEKGDCRDIR